MTRHRRGGGIGWFEIGLIAFIGLLVLVVAIALK